MLGRGDDLKKQSSSKKAQVTRAVNSINSLCKSLLARKTSGGSLYGIDGHDPNQIDEYNTQWGGIYTKYQETLEKLLDTMSLNEQPDEPTLNKPPEHSSSIIHIDNSSLPFN
ncbi:unnamed protein product [Lepeophtheirus salmonis]|uniref:(salmon louse) hypothetical protein n=1 Tax=Lepeophtheirus salmonis TaxID=72036 RepID=A0A7R8HAH2_LEPSM|nr:unnamed protein product [Lepeophtheirus salmonis]CAF2966895.1 unnamed protein product [Lepeophtheirus salmonis]